MKKSATKIFILLLICLCSGIISCSSLSRKNLTVYEALSVERLKKISSLPRKVVGSGGFYVKLPDADVTMVNDPVFRKATDCLVIQGKTVLPKLLIALKDKQTHIRYGALIALERITGSKYENYGPLGSPGCSENKKAYKQWEKIVDYYIKHGPDEVPKLKPNVFFGDIDIDR